jgi:hypothetical protein
MTLLSRPRSLLPLSLLALVVPFLGGAHGCEPEPPPPPECICTADYSPVCGVDGITYSNPCAAECEGVEIAHPGECESVCRTGADCRVGERCVVDPIPLAAPPDVCLLPGCVEPVGHCEACVCADIWDPICGTDGNTYSNACEAECAHVEIAHYGECDASLLCLSDEECGPGGFCDYSRPLCERECDGPHPAVCYGQCRTIECPAVLCDLYCEHGYAPDERGCPSCRCNPPPITECTSDEQCLDGEYCNVFCTDDCPPGAECAAPSVCRGICEPRTEPLPIR